MTDSNQRTYLNILFDPEDLVCTGDTPYITAIEPLRAQLKLRQFICINPLCGPRRDSNVTKFRNILVEFDKHDLARQLKIIKESQLPHSTIVFSGSKSFHVIISLEEPLKSKDEYSQLVKRVYKKMGGADVVDISTSNPSRFSRAPCVNRNNGNFQAVQYLGTRIKNEELLSWLGPEPVRSKPKSLPPTGKLSAFTLYFLNFGAAPGLWNRQLFISVCDMARNGMDEDTIIEKCRTITGHLDFKDLKTIKSALRAVISDRNGTGL